MYLKSLELTGFKSFAKKGVLEFKTPITSIVGPNGSGKSNVAEAFRFVLGEQSIKSMRGKRGEDLIWNGGGESARANRASVKVAFDNSKKIFNIDFPEVAIERVVHRDGINEYLINGSQVRLRDIIELLAGAHIGASGHHIISQGEADRILNAPFKERKAMIEDALGLKIYQYKKQESERKLLKTEENIKSVESLRREIAPHIKFLKKQVEKVEKVVQMKNDLTLLYREYFKREDDYLKYTEKDFFEKERPLRVKLEGLEKELSKAREVLSKSADKDEKSDEVIAIEGKIKVARDEKDILTRRIGRIEGEIASFERLFSQEKKRAESLADKVVKLSDILELGGTIHDEVEKVILSEDVGALKKVLLFVRDSVKNFISKNKTQVDDSFLKHSQEDLDKLNPEKKDLDSKLQEQKKIEEGLHKDYSTLRAEIEKEKDSNRDAEKALFQIMGEQKDVIAAVNLIEAQKAGLALEEAEFKRELQEGAALVGRAALDFADFEIKDRNANNLSLEVIKQEVRAEQKARQKVIEKIKIRLEDAGGGGGEEVMKEYKEVSGRDEFLGRELGDLHTSADALKKLILELDEKLSTQFSEGIKKINDEFGKLFMLMFGGGHASLTLVHEKKRKQQVSLTDDEIMENDILESDGGEEEIEEGLDITVSLPRKKIKGLVMLSGGERALTSIALLFAISQVNPPPFIILDETDAALDEANSKKYGDLVENLSKHSQLILITHNRETMSRAGVIYGVTMGGSGVSALLSIAFEQAVEIAK